MAVYKFKRDYIIPTGVNHLIRPMFYDGHHECIESKWKV